MWLLVAHDLSIATFTCVLGEGVDEDVGDVVIKRPFVCERHTIFATLIEVLRLVVVVARF